MGSVNCIRLFFLPYLVLRRQHGMAGFLPPPFPQPFTQILAAEAKSGFWHHLKAKEAERKKKKKKKKWEWNAWIRLFIPERN
jgi:hypothetical protein